jgi:E3 ubiquitin-protein ligase MARCH6
VHQDCLEAWLAHSKKEVCELCLTKYQFEPEYRPDTPSVIPLHILLKSVISVFIFNVLPISFRVLLATVIWLIMVPLGTTVAYCTCLRRAIPFVTNFSWSTVASAVCYGLVIDAVMALSLLILMSFADFIRNNWRPAANEGGNANNNVANNGRNLGLAPNIDNNNPAPVDIHFNPPREVVDQLQQVAPNMVPREPEHNQLAVRNEEHARADPMDIPFHERWANEFGEFVQDERRIPNEQDPYFSASEYEDILDEDDDAGFEEEFDPPINPAADHENHQAPPVLNPEPNNNNNNNNGFDVPAVDMMEDNQVQLAIMDILGIEGPMIMIFRKAAWLLAFSSVYLTLLGFFPYVIGSMAFRYLRLKVDQSFPNLFEEWTVKRLFNKVESLSAEFNPPLQFMDFLMMAAGYFIIIAMLFSLDILLSRVRSIRYLEGIESVANPFRQLTVMVKVGVLLTTRIFLLPITIGSAIVVLVSYQVIDLSLDAWVSLLVHNCVSIYGICWVAGITFMLSVTVSMLQVREVLHPDIFSKWIKPQEAHNDLIASLIKENGYMQARRVIMSFLVYSLLLLIFVGAPLQLFNFLRYSHAHLAPADSPFWQSVLASFHVFPTHFFDLKVWYYIPSLQIPIELLLGHIAFLSVLDQKKDLIGRIQHKWTVWAAEKLGMTRFIIPLPMLKRLRKNRRRGAATGTTRGTRKWPHPIRRRVPSPVATLTPTALPAIESNVSHSDTAMNPSSHAKINEDENMAIEEVIEVGPPLQRPPYGWDIRNSQNSSRWAYIGEEPSLVEQNVAPRVVPTYWLIRTIALVTVSCTLVVLIVLFVITVPLAIGRLLTHLLCIPQIFYHDPLHYFLGVFVVKIALDLFEMTPAWHILYVKLPYVRHLSASLQMKFVWVACKRIVTYALVGMSLRFFSMYGSLNIFMANPVAAGEVGSLPLLSLHPVELFADAVRGCILLDGVLLLLLRSGAAVVIARCFKDNALSAWLLCCKSVFDRIGHDLAPVWDPNQNAFPSLTNLSDGLMLWDTVVVTPTLTRVIWDVTSLAGVVGLRQWVLWQIFQILGADGGHSTSMFTQLMAASHDATRSIEKVRLLVSYLSTMPWTLWLWWIIWLGSLVMVWFGDPIRRTVKIVYHTIRDQHYLIGKRLKNAVRENRRDPPSSSSATEAEINAPAVL